MLYNFNNYAVNRLILFSDKQIHTTTTKTKTTTTKIIFDFKWPINYRCGPGSSVGIATDDGLDRPRIESRWGEIFRPSKPALRPTQPPVQWVLDLFRV
jgi:hypothetical protein